MPSNDRRALGSFQQVKPSVCCARIRRASCNSNHRLGTEPGTRCSRIAARSSETMSSTNRRFDCAEFGATTKLARRSVLRRPFFLRLYAGSAYRRTPIARCHFIVSAIRTNGSASSCTGLLALWIDAWRISFPGNAPVRPYRRPPQPGGAPWRSQIGLWHAQDARRECRPREARQRRRDRYSPGGASRFSFQCDARQVSRPLRKIAADIGIGPLAPTSVCGSRPSRLRADRWRCHLDRQRLALRSPRGTACSHCARDSVSLVATKKASGIFTPEAARYRFDYLADRAMSSFRHLTMHTSIRRGPCSR
jgi:hypothetical protein